MDDTSRNGSEPTRTAGQKALAGLRLTRIGISDQDAAEAVGTSPRQIEAVRGVLNREPGYEAMLESGEVTLNAAQVGAGFRQHKMAAPGRAFGKGDKWPQIVYAVMQYLGGWAGRDYKFTHVPPREAAKRVKAIDEMIDGLQKCRADLMDRSVRATSAAPRT